MKKNLLFTFLILCIINAVSSATGTSSNTKQKSWSKNARHKSKLKAEFKPLSTQVNVPSVIKSSYWDINTNSWSPSTRQVDEYQNSRLTKSLIMQYDALDTFSRISYSYDLAGRETEELNEYNAFGTFQPQSRITRSYSNPTGESAVILEESYDVSTSQWLSVARTTEIFDDRGNMIRNIREINNNGTWEISFGDISSITYLGSTNKFIQQIDSTYDNNTSSFVPLYKYTRTYNLAGQAEEIIAYRYENGWVGEELDSVFYSAVTGEPTELIAYIYNPFSSNFEKGLKLDRLVWTTFDPNNDLFNSQPDSYYTSYWDLNSWLEEERFSTTRPDNNGSKIELYEALNNIAWEPTERYNTLYNSNKDLTEETGESYDNNAWIYEFGQKYQHQYDINNNRTESILSYYDSVDSLFTNSLKLEFSDFISITQGFGNTKNNLNVRVYPNPSSNGNISIELLSGKPSLMSVKVYSLTGSLVQEIPANERTNTVKIQNLNSGFYILEISNEDGISREKVIVE